MNRNLKCFIYFILIAFVCCDDVKLGNDTVDVKNSTNSVEDAELGTTTVASNRDFKKLTKKRCARHYDTNCLKVDLISSLEKLGRSTDLQLLPGVKLTANSDLFLAQRASDTKMEFSADNISQQLDELLKRRLVSYAKSLSLSIQIFDSDQKGGKSFSTSVFDNLFRQSVDGRGDKKPGKWSSTLVTAAILTGCTLLWMGLSSLMAMATKALAASLLSIVISIVTAYRSSGNSHSKSTTYEIVAKPVYSHAYAAEVQHEPHPAASGYQYGRNMEWDKVASMSSRSEVQLPVPVLQTPTREDAHQLAYRTQVRSVYKREAVI